ncbi:hypothetical protein HMPREF9418_0989 [Neisseria macacae ATCC 33926]|uniref:Uncharacterized protein n=2 Tax=Neisseria TaxID=482 RepID=I2NRA1_NEISI|nr:hypothetical protein HMPREF9418_0989 [Neisseria macacae ATCC 33926]EIG28362.1 hypothetical protein HMPREF1051_1222 [Neisseria sicca VK64]
MTGLFFCLDCLKSYISSVSIKRSSENPESEFSDDLFIIRKAYR